MRSAFWDFQRKSRNHKGLRFYPLFNFIKNTADPSFVNPCDAGILQKTFHLAKCRQWSILEKDVLLNPKTGAKMNLFSSPKKVADRLREYIRRHANLSANQRDLGKVSDDEAIRWIENIFR